MPRNDDWPHSHPSHKDILSGWLLVAAVIGIIFVIQYF